MTIKRINSSRNGKPFHWYKIDGSKADGVTTLIGDGMRKKALEYWSANFTAEYAVDNWDNLSHMPPSERLKVLKKCRFDKRDAAANRGTEVHQYAEQLVHGAEVEPPDEIAGYVEQCAKFLDEWKIEPHLVERTVASREWNYAGTFDLIDVKDGAHRIFDYKTSGSGIYGETAMQLAAYARAPIYLGENDEELPMPPVEAGFGVWVREHEYVVYPLDISEKTYKAFLHVAYVARQTKDTSKWLGDPVAAGGAL